MKVLVQNSNEYLREKYRVKEEDIYEVVESFISDENMIRKKGYFINTKNKKSICLYENEVMELQ